MSRTTTSRQGFHKTTLIWLLTLVTVAWGSVAVGHHHLGIDHEHCHVCLLPQVTDAPPAPPSPQLTPFVSTPVTVPVHDYSSPANIIYQSRAPPP